MALYNGNKRIEGSRSNTALVKSGHMSPAEEWLLDPRFRQVGMSSVFNDGVLFQYMYGGPGAEEVVIPKGRVVGVAKPIKSFTTKKFKTVMTLPGMSLNNNVIGMVPYNICKDYFEMDRFGGNAPSIITLDYVTLPYMPNIVPDARMTQDGVLAEEAAISVTERMPWGAVIGTGIVEGDYLKSTPSGRLTKWIKGTDNYVDVVGQILASDFNAEPWGWYKWMLLDESSRNESDEFMNRSGASNLPSDEGYPYDPTYTEGNTIYQQYQSELVTNPTGIPGLHDGSGNFTGYGKNDTDYTTKIGKTPIVTVVDTLMAFQFLDYAGGLMKNIQSVSKIKLGEVELTSDKYTMNYLTGVVTIKMPINASESDVEVTFRAFHYGTPSFLDFKGVVGSFNVLLKK